MSVKHANISVFVPHLGCPQTCSFCNQRFIARTSETPDEETVKAAVETAINSKNYSAENTEIAFFGGSFTAIEKEYMLRLLSAAHEYVKDKKVAGIRVSTRPDAINQEILDLLKGYGVTAIELGAQSMCDEVLVLNKRGHTVNDVISSSSLIKQYGFSLGLQMMTGLYGSSDEKDIYTAQKIIELNPDTVRIYPTIVLENTFLADMWGSGVYTPQTLEKAVELAAKLLILFKEQNINVIRTGLHTIDTDRYVAGPWHPSFKELCDAEIFYKKAVALLNKQGEYTVFVHPSNISKMVGQKRSNIAKFKALGFDCKVKSDDTLGEYDLKILRM